MRAAVSFEMLVSYYNTMWHDNSEDLNLSHEPILICTSTFLLDVSIGEITLYICFISHSAIVLG